MKAYKTQARVEQDGELHLKDLPFKKWDRVEVIVLSQEQAAEEERQAALKRMRERAERMQFRSAGPYPTRDELHERH
jgi:hypothetical protein